MEKRRLGRTGFEVTLLSFGALPIQRCTMDEAGPILHKALDMGINFIDTARAYTDSEAKIGHHISTRRNEYFLATKSFARTYEQMAKDIDTSLEMMQTDRIDLYQIHNARTPEELTIVLGDGGAYIALKEAKAAGKIKHIGITGHRTDILMEAISTNLFDTVQIPFNPVEQSAIDTVFPKAKELDMGIIVMKPLGGGLLRYPELSLRFVTGYDISVMIPGMDEIDQIEKNIAAITPYRPLMEDERKILLDDAADIGQNFCRRCGYCLPCPVGIDIPSVFLFGLQYTHYGVTAAKGRYQNLPVRAKECIECGNCEQRCPYSLPIRKKMKDYSECMD